MGFAGSHGTQLRRVDAVRAFFGLDRTDATYLFDAESYDYDVDGGGTKPAEVAARIREMTA